MGCSSCGGRKIKSYISGINKLKKAPTPPPGKKYIYTRVNGAMRPVLVDIEP